MDDTNANNQAPESVGDHPAMKPKKTRHATGRSRWSKKKIVLLLVLGIILLPLLWFAGRFALLFLFAGSVTPPVHNNVFLRNEYINGVEELKIDAYQVKLLGATHDASRVAVWVTSALPLQLETSELRVYDGTTKQMVHAMAKTASCSSVVQGRFVYCQRPSGKRTGFFTAVDEIQKIDITTGQIVSRLDLELLQPQDPKFARLGQIGAEFDFIGSKGEVTYLMLEAPKSLFQNSFKKMVAVSDSDTKVAWQAQLDGSETCVVVSKETAILCTTTKMDPSKDDGSGYGVDKHQTGRVAGSAGDSSPRTVTVFDPTTGQKRLSDHQTKASGIIVADDGWIEIEDLSDKHGIPGFDPSRPRKYNNYVFNLEGKELGRIYTKESFPITRIVPQPSHSFSEGPVVYDLATLRSLVGNSEDILIDEQGKIVVRTDMLSFHKLHRLYRKSGSFESFLIDWSYHPRFASRNGQVFFFSDSHKPFFGFYQLDGGKLLYEHKPKERTINVFGEVKNGILMIRYKLLGDTGDTLTSDSPMTKRHVIFLPKQG